MRNSLIVLFLFMLLAALIVVSFALSAERRKSMGHRSSLEPAAGIIHLPQPRYESQTSVEKALLERRSKREYRSEQLTLNEVGQLLWAAEGITHEREYRTAPSAGALYPLETYVVAGNVKNLPAGFYRYIPRRHELVPMFPGDIRRELCNAALYQESIREAPASLVFSAVFSRTTGKYGKRGIRYVHMEAGNASQNVYLQSVSLNIGTVVIGAFDDASVRRALSLPIEEEPMLIMPVGKK
jgi:SagB-type dehydrogenase family enzyme